MFYIGETNLCQDHLTPLRYFPFLLTADLYTASVSHLAIPSLFSIKSQIICGQYASSWTRIWRSTALLWIFILLWNLRAGEKLWVLCVETYVLYQLRISPNFPSALSLPPPRALSLPLSSVSRWPTLTRQTVIPQWATFSFPLQTQQRHTRSHLDLLVCWLDDCVQKKGGRVRVQENTVSLNQVQMV